ncbi:uncharacterized protein LOC135488574 [Lineus longissimus]|uniref:uncharacterized protein LOC135488574 n=1 Tax=Lineus longissimus TaxID=88925 RepID=UPI00315CA08E
MKFCDYIRAKSSSKTLVGEQFRKITVNDLEKARLAVVKYVQKEAYGQEIAALQKTGRVKASSQLKSLNPVIIDGVLRVGGRLSRAPLSHDAKFPMIVPRGSHLASILIYHFHAKVAHAGQEQVLAALRETFWIQKGRIAVRKIIRSCIGCRRRQAKRMHQLMADLPRMRLQAFEPPFTRTGLDCFGPLLVRKNRSTLKRWGLIFICLNVRAVHLEVLESMDTSSFINGLRCFTGRRGDPKDIWSDNGSNFKGGERELRQARADLNQKQIEDELSQEGIRWHFQPPTAAHMSRVWERLVKSVKGTLKAILGEALVTEEVLFNAMIEAERIVNSRPLCKVSDDPQDDQALSPSHFLCPRGILSVPPGDFDEREKYRSKWKHAQILAGHFWDRWLREYLPMLMERRKWREKVQNVCFGDLVMMAEDNLPKGEWPMARVVRTFPGDDGCVRVVEVKAKNGNLYVRPISKL